MDGRSKHRNKAALSTLSGIVWEGPKLRNKLNSLYDAFIENHYFHSWPCTFMCLPLVLAKKTFEQVIGVAARGLRFYFTLDLISELDFPLWPS